MGELAKLEMSSNHFEEAQRYTTAIIKHAPDDDMSIMVSMPNSE